VPSIDENAYGYSVPTATAYGSNKSASSGARLRPGLAAMARKNLWPTPTAASADKEVVGSQKGRNIVAVAKQNWPTPWENRAMAAKLTPKAAQAKFPNLETEVAKTIYLTPKASDCNGSIKLSTANKRAKKSKRGVGLGEMITKTYQQEVGGQLNPRWVEWLMGWPIGWTDLKPLEMDKYQQWLRQHGKSFTGAPEYDYNN